MLKEDAAFRAKFTSWTVLVNLLKDIPDRVNDSASSGDLEYKYGCKVTDVIQDPRGKNMSVHYIDPATTTTSTTTADLLIGADGASSTVRTIVAGVLPRKYAGYVLWRGIVPFSALPLSTVSLMELDTATFQYGPDFQAISYLIPSKTPTATGTHDIFHAKYHNIPESELDDHLTDVDGNKHALSMQAGKVRSEIVARLQKIARQELAPVFQDLVYATDKPIMSVITDLLSPSSTFMNDKVLLVGEAVAVARPHTFAGTAQAAFAALQLREYVQGRISVQEWGERISLFSKTVVDAGVALGQNLMTGTLDNEEEMVVEKYHKNNEIWAELGRDLGRMTTTCGVKYIC